MVSDVYRCVYSMAVCSSVQIDGCIWIAVSFIHVLRLSAALDDFLKQSLVAVSLDFKCMCNISQCFSRECVWVCGDSHVSGFMTHPSLRGLG